jgi:ABC-type transporter Mla maintaining outer membrane lipid asymmetry ATPase subunit MlaF
MAALEFAGVVKDYRGMRPLRIASLSVAPGERVAIAGLDAPAAETFINLATGAGLPDEGEVRVMGEPTSAIIDGDRWLASLDRFGIVSHRAVLLDSATVAQNIAMSYSLAIEPIPDDVRAQVDAVAAAAGLTADVLDISLASAGPAARVRTHLARALSIDPRIIVLEHATLGVPREDVPALAASIVRGVEGRNVALVALSNDVELSKGLKARRLTLDAGTGALKGNRPHLFSWFD